MQVRFDVPKNLKDGDILMFENGRFRAVQVSTLIKPLQDEINDLTIEINALKSFAREQQERNKRIAERWKGVKR